MLISLGECLKIAKDYTEEVNRLYGARKEAAFVIHGKDEDVKEPDESVEKITKKINELNERIRILRSLVAQRNLDALLDIELDDGRQIRLAEGIVLLGQLLKEKGEIATFLSAPKRKRENAYSGIVEYTSITFDQDAIKRYAKTLDQEIRALRREIDKANIGTMVEVDSDQEWEETDEGDEGEEGEQMTDIKTLRNQLERKKGERNQLQQTIAFPVKHFQQEAEKAGATLDGEVVMALSNDAGWMKDVARKALEEGKEND